MDKITKYDPFRDILDLRREMDRLIDRSFGSTGVSWSSNWDLPLDVVENDNEYVVKASLPGIKSDDIEITYNDRMLTISGEVKGDEEKKDQRYHVRERWFGKFSRSVQLPASIKADEISADYEAGVLTLRMPKTEEMKPRRITVKSEGRVIEAKVHKN